MRSPRTAAPSPAPPRVRPSTCKGSSPRRARTTSSDSSPSVTSRRKKSCVRSVCSRAKSCRCCGAPPPARPRPRRGGNAMRRFLAALVSGIYVLAPAPVLAQAYPSKTVRIIVGTSPGGSPDVFARLIAQKMSESWGPVVVENRIGANGNIAAEMVSKSASDGYTAYICDSAIWAINPHLYAKVPYRPLDDFAGITTISTLPTFLTIHPSVPATTYAEFVAYAKKNPGKLSYASAGNGSIHHITTELFKSL